jgi:predicted nucleotidyltransferase
MNTTILSKLKKATKIYKKYNIDNIYLVGSYSRWEENENSDVDLYLKTKEFLDIYKYMNLKFELEIELWKKVDLIMDNNLKSWVKEILLKDLVLIK